MSPKLFAIRLSLKTLATKEPKVKLGSRYRPDRVEIRNRAAGTYECLNPMVDGALTVTELQTQRALLAPIVKDWSAARIEAARTARSPKPAPVIAYRAL